TYHKSKGNEVFLNMPIWKSDYSYASWVFQNKHRFEAHEIGGIAVDPQIELPDYIERLRPDYRLFNLKHSLGYTFRACFRFRQCPFCKVPLLPVRIKHHSIWEFHSKDFDTIELLNNNTFFDPHWEETFKEIYKARLKVIENGMDLRLLDDHKAWWIKQLRWKNQPKFAWDRMKDEKKIIAGMKLLQKYKIDAMVYVLMGFDTTSEEDLYRCEIINSMGFDPFPMLYEPTQLLRKLRRMIYLRYYRKYKTIAEAWKEYKRVR
ncbi:unnamed protein product, partial [marine sediment metagenome]